MGNKKTLARVVFYIFTQHDRDQEREGKENLGWGAGLDSFSRSGKCGSSVDLGGN